MQDAERIAALEAAVEELRSQLEAMRVGRTMRQTHRCPACGHGKVLHFQSVPDENTELGILSLQKVVHFFSARGRPGALEAFVCRNCRIVEWHAVTLDDVSLDRTNVDELSVEDAPEPPDEPYR